MQTEYYLLVSTEIWKFLTGFNFQTYTRGYLESGTRSYCPARVIITIILVVVGEWDSRVIITLLSPYLILNFKNRFKSSVPCLLNLISYDWTFPSFIFNAPPCPEFADEGLHYVILLKWISKGKLYFFARCSIIEL